VSTIELRRDNRGLYVKAITFVSKAMHLIKGLNADVCEPFVEKMVLSIPNKSRRYVMLEFIKGSLELSDTEIW
jgi:hypothetical protein